MMFILKLFVLQNWWTYLVNIHFITSGESKCLQNMFIKGYSNRYCADGDIWSLLGRLKCVKKIYQLNFVASNSSVKSLSNVLRSND